MSVTATAKYTWTRNGGSKTSVVHGSSTNGYWTLTSTGSGFATTEDIVIKSVKLVSTTSCRNLVSEDILICIDGLGRTIRIPQSSMSTYAAHTGQSVPIVCLDTFANTIFSDVQAGKKTNRVMRVYSATNSDTTRKIYQIAGSVKLNFEIEYEYDFANPLMQMGTLNVELGTQQTWPLTIQETGFSNYYINYSLSFARTTQTSSVQFTETLRADEGDPLTITSPASWGSYYKFNTTIPSSYIKINVELYRTDAYPVFDSVESADDMSSLNRVGHEGISDPGESEFIESIFPVETPFYEGSFAPSSIALTKAVFGIRLSNTSFTPIVESSGTLFGDLSENFRAEPSSSTASMNVRDYTGVHFASTPSETYSTVTYYLDIYRASGNVPNDWQTDFTSFLAGDTQNVSGTYARLTTVSSANPNFDYGPFGTDGEIIVVGSAKDGRNYTSSRFMTKYTVYAYNVPVVSEVYAYRTDANGQANDDGKYITVSIPSEGISFSSLNGSNSLTIQVLWRESGQATEYTAVSNLYQSTYLSGSSYVLTFAKNEENDPYFSKDITYEAVFVIEDFAVTITKTIRISSGNYTLHFKNGGMGIGIGKTCNNMNRIEINHAWTVCIDEYPWIQYGTQKPADSDGHIVGQIWLVKA